MTSGVMVGREIVDMACFYFRTSKLRKSAFRTTRRRQKRNHKEQSRVLFYDRKPSRPHDLRGTCLGMHFPGMTKANTTSLCLLYAETAWARVTVLIGSERLFMTLANSSRFSDCAPSESACSGEGCTSIMRPSAPAASAARRSEEHTSELQSQ